MADRKLPTSISPSPVTGATYMDAVAEKVRMLFDASAMRPTSMTNTGNDYTIEVDPVLDADVVPGMAFYCRPSVSNTGAARLRVHAGNPYYPLTKADGSPLAQREFMAGTVYLVVFLSGAFVIASGSGGGGSAALDYQVFTASGTWTKPTGLGADALALIEAWGGGGGSLANNTYRGGGGGGAYVWRWMRLGELGASEPVQVGAGGVTNTQPGGTGGTSSFGSHVTAFGGGGGYSGASGAFGSGGGGGWGSAGQGGSSGADGSNGAIWSPIVGGGKGGGVTGGGDGEAAGYGGGGGGQGPGGGNRPGGASLFGGKGGDGGQAGSPPGGGGGGGAPGARGEVRVRVIG